MLWRTIYYMSKVKNVLTQIYNAKINLTHLIMCLYRKKKFYSENLVPTSKLLESF